MSRERDETLAMGDAPCPVGLCLKTSLAVAAVAYYTRAFGDGPRKFEPWSSDVDDTWAGSLSPNYHTNGRTFPLSTDLACIAALHGGSLVVLASNS
ncbi:hypothetical protein TNCV_4612941 [Trichonephila clavipes]|nr:hypothetical protein TNCV_4612941 [Trichonephila clavipes]